MNLKESIKMFLRENAPPKEWFENLGEYLPISGKVSTKVALIRVVEGDEKKEVLTLNADEICSEEQLQRLSFAPPDGLWTKWSNLVLDIGGRMLADRIEGKMNSRGLSEVPKEWSVQFGWLRHELASDFR